MTEDWRASLDRREAVDLTKAFVSICHPLLLAKLKAYGFTDDALGLMAAYLLGKTQRFKLMVFILTGELYVPVYHRGPWLALCYSIHLL